MAGRPLHVRRLGIIPYADALALQRALVTERQAGRVPDTLLLLQHPHVITLGSKGDGGRGHILATPERLDALGVTVSDTGRGGDVTYHGPGQLVAYPVIDLQPDRKDVHRYVRDLEEVMIRLCADYRIEAGRMAGMTGTWIPSRGEKIGAIGVRISRWVTSHGVAFNVSTQLEFFQLIVPCGIRDRGVVSLETLIGRDPGMPEIEARFVQHFCDIFGRTVVDAQG